MLIQVGYEIAFVFPQPTPVVILLYVHPSRAANIRRGDNPQIEPALPIREFSDAFGNRCGRILAPAGRMVLRNDAVVEDSGQPDPQVWNACQHPVQDLPNEALQFLLASRYCEVDSELKNLAGNLFNATPAGWSRVQSICNFVYQHIRFDYTQARQSYGSGDVSRTSRRLPRLHASGNYLVPMHEHSGSLLHRISRRHRRTALP